MAFKGNLFPFWLLFRRLQRSKGTCGALTPFFMPKEVLFLKFFLWLFFWLNLAFIEKLFVSLSLGLSYAEGVMDVFWSFIKKAALREVRTNWRGYGRWNGKGFSKTTNDLKIWETLVFGFVELNVLSLGLSDGYTPAAVNWSNCPTCHSNLC